MPPDNKPTPPEATQQPPIPQIVFPPQLLQGAPPQPLAGLYIPIVHAVDANLANVIIQTINQSLLGNPGLARVYLPIACGGGQIAAGLAIYEYLRSLPPSIDVITHNIGSVDSAAVLIYIAGTKRFMAKGSTFLFHPIRSESVMQNPSAEDANALQMIVERHTVQYASLVATRTKIRKTSALRYMKNTKVISEREALGFDLAHNVESLPEPLTIMR